MNSHCERKCQIELIAGPLVGFKLLTYNRCLLALVSCSALNIFIIPCRAFCCPTRLWSVSERLSLHSVLLPIKYTVYAYPVRETVHDVYGTNKGTGAWGTWMISSFKRLKKKIALFRIFNRRHLYKLQF